MQTKSISIQAWQAADSEPCRVVDYRLNQKGGFPAESKEESV